MSGLKSVYGEDTASNVAKAKVLVVGAGGIGCELLKNLVLSGFQNIEILDLDTIDVSNLNRQFLFRPKHVGQSKAMVARESALVFNPKAKIVAHHGNIKTAEFGLEYFQQFELVMNALDNLDARRHVNRLCLAADIPLIESGTAGFLGQVQVIKKRKFECFECQPKPVPKSFPVCTIRSTPSTPIHCIVWAKMLFERLFGKEDDSNAVSELGNLKASRTVDNKVAFPEAVFKQVFTEDIEKLASMKDMWKDNKAKKPSPLNFADIKQSVDTDGAADSAALLKDQEEWSLKQNAEVFASSADKLAARTIDVAATLSFDKDDDDALDFVTAAANLRATAFSIPTKSRYDVKEYAGNIIPAIATTNAIIAGFIVLEAFKVLGGRLDDAKTTFARKAVSNKAIIQPMEQPKPNPKCFVCSDSMMVLKADVQTFTVGMLVEKVLKARLGMIEPTIALMDSAALIYECGDDLEEDEIEQYAATATKPLADARAGDGVRLRIDDQMQVVNIAITIVHKSDFDEENTDLFEISGDSVVVRTETEKKDADTKDDQDDFCMIVSEDRKRKREEHASSASKKQAVQVPAADIIELD